MTTSENQTPAGGAANRAAARNIENAYSLSPMQQGMLFHSLYAPESGVYFEQLTCTLIGDLDVAAFQRAWQQVAERHPVLRSAFAWRRLEKPVQAVYKEITIPLVTHDWRSLPAEQQEQEFLAYLAADRSKGFELTRAPLIRLALLRTGEREHRLVWSHHHILMDGWSMPVLLKEVFTFYEAFARGQTAAAVAGPVPRPYKDYIAWLASQDLAAAEAYWRKALAGWSTPTPLAVAATDDALAAQPQGGGAECEVRLSAATTDGLNTLARQNGVTLSTVLQGAWGILLSRYSGEQDVVFGATVSGRPATLPGADAMVGLFINTLPVRVQVDPAAALGPWLRQLQAQLAEMRQFEYTPLVQIQGWSDIPRDKALFDTIMVFENYPVDAALREQFLPGHGGSLHIRDVRGFEQTNFPITLVSGPSRELVLKISYDRTRFDEPAITRMLGHLATLIEGMVRQGLAHPALDSQPAAAGPAAALGALPMLSAAERRRLLIEWATQGQDAANDRAAPPATLAAAFEAQAARTPAATAVLGSHTGEPVILTYAELNRRANRLARRLRRLGVGPEQLVGLFFERSPEMIVALLGILKAGAAYLPLDPDYPVERLEFMLADSETHFLLTQAQLADRLSLRRVQVLCVDPAGSAAMPADGSECDEAWGDGPDGGADEGDLDPLAGPDNLAYVIFTSGSTGTPKGVMVEHRNVLNHARALIEQTQIGPRDRVLQFVSLSFDAAGEEFYPTLLSGATLVLPGKTQTLIGPELPRFCEHYGVTIMHMPAAVWHAVIDDLLAQRVSCSAPLRLLMLGGDAPDVSRLAAFSRMLGREISFINLYGPTEATITTTTYRTTTAPARTQLPIGRPIANAWVYVLDAEGRPVPIGVAGEIYVGGAGVARGYLGRPELTAEKFVLNSEVSDGAPVRLYRTGDLGRWLPDGNLEFLGRADNQVKIRGFRVEPGEIEAVLRRVPGVREAVVVPWDGTALSASGGGRRLVAYVVPLSNGAPFVNAAPLTNGAASGGARLDPADLRAGLKKVLPDYMTPSAFIILPALPLTATGKVDRKALPPPEEAALAPGGTYAAPRSPDEDLLAGIFAHVLALPGASAAVGVNDSFFDLGGHSLLATRLASRIREVFGVEVPLRDLFQSPSVAGIAALIGAARQSEASEPAPPITAEPRTGAPLPLSFAQQRLWFLDQLEPGNLFYNIPTVMRLRGRLDVKALTAALNEIVRRHEALRTTFGAKGGIPHQIIAPALTVETPLTDLSALPEGERETRANELARAEIRTPFDLAAGPLLRSRLIRLAPEEHIAVLTIHHIVTDGWSMGVLVAELAKLYEGCAHLSETPGFAPAALSAVLPEPPVQYADYAAWQRAWLEGEGQGDHGSPLRRQLAYWKQQLAGAPARLDLPTDRPRPAVQSSNGATYTFRFSSELSNGLVKLSRKEGVTLFMTLLAGYQALLSRYSGQGDIVVGSALANRQRAEVEGLIGFFVNTLVFRTRFDPSPAGQLTFRELLARVRETALGAYANQDVPFEMLVDSLLREGVQPERTLSHSPLFQAAFSLQNVPLPVRELHGLILEPVNLDKSIAGYDMLLQVTETDTAEGRGIACAWEYNTDLFDAVTIERMAGHLQTLFAAAVADPAQPVALMALLTQRERELMLVEWNCTEAPFPSDGTIHSLFEEQARRVPHAQAAVFALPSYMTGAQTVPAALSYAELDRRANQLAHHLVALGVKANVLVGIATERSLEMVTGILGILKAGGAYLPLDPNYPAERLAFMLADAGVQVLITQAHVVDQLPLNTEGHRVSHVIRLDADWGEIAGQPQTAPAVRVTADDLAYCIYTSGSTGRPKGTLLRHRGLCNLADVHRREFEMREGKRVLQFSPFSFDASVWETVMALRNGATLVLTRQEVLASGPDLLKLLQEQRITTVTLPPSLLSVLSPAAAGTGSLPDLQTVIAAGERCTNEIVKAWTTPVGGGRSFFDAYGPTETTVCASMHRCDPDVEWPFGGPPIGKPISNFQLYVVDENLQPQPIGVPGELLVGGVGVAQGYLKRPELTAERFIRNPFSRTQVTQIGTDSQDRIERSGRSIPSASSAPNSPRLYRSGDLVRWLPDGNLEFLGRIDDQVKVRGFRIELGEVESVLREHAGVRDAVVTARGDNLVGYFLPVGPAAAAPSAAQLRAHLRARLPEYMMPAAFVVLDAFPRSPAGKIDRKALPAPDEGRRDAETEYVAPRTETEQQLTAAIGELLKLERVGVEDNFFELGGHSLLATQLISRIREQFKVEVALKSLFEQPTVSGLAAVVDEAVKKQAAEGAKVADALATVKGMTPEQVRALLASKRAQAGPGGKVSG